MVVSLVVVSFFVVELFPVLITVAVTPAAVNRPMLNTSIYFFMLRDCSFKVRKKVEDREKGRR